MCVFNKRETLVYITALLRTVSYKDVEEEEEERRSCVLCVCDAAGLYDRQHRTVFMASVGPPGSG